MSWGQSAESGCQARHRGPEPARSLFSSLLSVTTSHAQKLERRGFCVCVLFAEVEREAGRLFSWVFIKPCFSLLLLTYFIPEGRS